MTMLKTRTMTAAAAMMALAGMAVADIPTEYTIEPVLPPGAPHSVSVRGLYDDGTMAVEVSNGSHNAVGNVQAWVKLADGTWVQALIPPGNNQINQLGAIAPDGTMYGTWRFNNNIFDQRGFQFTAAGTFTDFNRLLNASGAQSNTFFGAATNDYAFCRTSNLGFAYRVSDGAFLDLPVIRATPGLATGNAANGNNWFVGVSPSDSGSRATLWRLNGSGQFEATNLGLPQNPIPDATSTARGINENGVVVGWTGTFSNNDAFIWTEADGMRALPRLDPTRSHFAYDVNEAGLVVGYRASSGSAVTAVIWDSATDEVADLLPRVTNPAGWDQLLDAQFITSDGRIMGRGVLNGLNTAYLLTPVGGPSCPGDWDGSGGVDGDDITAFFADWQAGDADIDGSGGTDGDDITFFFVRWQAGC